MGTEEIPELPDWVKTLIEDAAEKGRLKGWEDGYRHAGERIRSDVERILERYR